ncbi:MAG: hypothetical protein R3C11_10665 [Planctomycetaceae bacterium]
MSHSHPSTNWEHSCHFPTIEPAGTLFLIKHHLIRDGGENFPVTSCCDIGEEWFGYRQSRWMQEFPNEIPLSDFNDPAGWDQISKPRFKRWLLIAGQKVPVQISWSNVGSESGISTWLKTGDEIEQLKFEESLRKSRNWQSIIEPAINYCRIEFIESRPTEATEIFLVDNPDNDYEPICYQVRVGMEIDSWVDLPDLRAAEECVAEISPVRVNGSYEPNDWTADEIQQQVTEELKEHRPSNQLQSGHYLPFALEHDGHKVPGVLRIDLLIGQVAEGKLFLLDRAIRPEPGRLLTRTSNWSIRETPVSYTKIVGTLLEIDENR